jgi:hypothetical protein
MPAAKHVLENALEVHSDKVAAPATLTRCIYRPKPKIVAVSLCSASEDLSFIEHITPHRSLLEPSRVEG